MTRIDRSLTPEQEAAFFAGRPVPPLCRRNSGYFWPLFFWALGLAMLAGTSYVHAF